MTAQSLYGSFASYFSQSGGTGSPGKSGGAGYSNDVTASGGGWGVGAGGAASSSGGNANGAGDVQNPSASAGSAGLVSAGVGLSSTDKSVFGTPFQQSFGGIANYQIIGSPGATGATGSASGGTAGAPASSPTAPIFASGGVSTGVLLLGFAALAAILLLRR